MPVVDGEEGAPGPILNLLELRLDDVEDDGNAIFIVVSHDALVRVCRVAADDAVFLASELGWVVRLHESLDLLLLHLHVLLLLLHSHDEATVCCQLVLTL